MRNYVLIFFMLAAAGSAESVKIDGDMSEWQSVTAAATDPLGDVAGDDLVDFTSVRVRHGGGSFFVQFETKKAIDFRKNAHRYCVFVDTDGSSRTGYRGYGNDWAIGSDMLIQGATLYRFSGKNPKEWKWESLGLKSFAVAKDGRAVELAVPIKELQIRRGQVIRLLLFGDNEGTKEFLPDKFQEAFINYPEKAKK